MIAGRAMRRPKRSYIAVRAGKYWTARLVTPCRLLAMRMHREPGHRALARIYGTLRPRWASGDRCGGSRGNCK